MGGQHRKALAYGCCSCDQERPTRNDRKCRMGGGGSCLRYATPRARDQAIERAPPPPQRERAGRAREGAVNGDDAREAVMICASARVTRGARGACDVRCSRPPPPPPSPMPHHMRATDRASECRRRRHAGSMDPPSLPGSGIPPLRARACMRERVRVHTFGTCSRRSIFLCPSRTAACARRCPRRIRARSPPRPASSPRASDRARRRRRSACRKRARRA